MKLVNESSTIEKTTSHLCIAVVAHLKMKFKFGLHKSRSVLVVRYVSLNKVRVSTERDTELPHLAPLAD